MMPQEVALQGRWTANTSMSCSTVDEDEIHAGVDDVDCETRSSQDEDDGTFAVGLEPHESHFDAEVQVGTKFLYELQAAARMMPPYPAERVGAIGTPASPLPCLLKPSVYSGRPRELLKSGEFHQSFTSLQPPVPQVPDYAERDSVAIAHCLPRDLSGPLGLAPCGELQRPFASMPPPAPHVPDNVDQNSAALVSCLPPPGLAESLGLASRGAALHKIGKCKPCAWFRKPQGCQSGTECDHCHACPAAELKVRRSSRLAVVRARKAVTNSAAPEQEALAAVDEGSEVKPQPSVEVSKTSDKKQFPSRGSALHGTGRCRPCVWFWKPQGCSNGAACRHCHICPEGEVKSRKEAKVKAMRLGAIEPRMKGSGAGFPMKLAALI